MDKKYVGELYSVAIPGTLKFIYWRLIILDLLGLAALRVHLGVALVAAVGGEPLCPVDTGLCTLSPWLRPSLPGPPRPGEGGAVTYVWGWSIVCKY